MSRMMRQWYRALIDRGGNNWQRGKPTMLLKLQRGLMRFEEIVAVLSLVAIVVLILLQVFNRYVLQSSLVWSEELARFLFIWLVYLSTSYAVRDNKHLAISFLLEYSRSARARFILQAVSLIATAIFAGFCIVWGVEMLFFLKKTGQQAPALEVSIIWVYLALPVCMGLMLIRCFAALWILIAGYQSSTSMDL